MPEIEPLAAVAVVGTDPDATADAALDLARDLARDRAVTVVDLLGDGAKLRTVALTDDPHGVYDCFEYGISFAAVSRPTSVGPLVSIIPPGTDQLEYDGTLPSPRWSRLIGRTRERGGVVVFAALAGTRSLDALTDRVDRVISVDRDRAGDASGREASPRDAETTRAATREVVLVDGEVVVPRRPKGERRRVLGGRRRQDAAPAVVGVAPRPRGRRLPIGVAAAAAVVLVGLLSWWVARQGQAGAAAPADTAAARTDTVTSTARLSGTDRLAPSAVALAGGAATVTDSAAAAVADPADSGIAATYALRVGIFPTFRDALQVLRRHAVRLGAATITPLPAPDAAPAPPGGRVTAQSYAVYVGAARTPTALDRLASDWTRIDGSTASPVRTPLALRLASRLTGDSAHRATVALRARGIPAYALLDDEGTATVYAGAFESAGQAAPLTASLETVGIVPVLAFRVGRMP